MTKNNILFLASKSIHRKKLLLEAGIDVAVIPQDADETKCDWGLPLPQVLANIALYKMEHAKLPKGKEGDVIFVLSADTMGEDKQGNKHGKPVDKAHAILMIKALSQGGYIGTAFCLDKKQYKNGSWQLIERITDFVSTTYIFDMPESWIEKYLRAFPDYLTVSGAIHVEGFGAQFLKSINGSYTTIIGLPLFELRQALEKIGFF